MRFVQILGPLVFTPQETEAMQSLTGMSVHRAKHGDKGIKVRTRLEWYYRLHVL
jgi:hypothetical protein